MKCYHNDLADANHLTGYCHTGDTKSQYNFKIFTLRGMNMFQFCTEGDTHI